MVIGDLYDIEERLQELDPEISIDFDNNSGNYRVYHKGYFIMDWPRPLDDRLIKHMRKIDVRRKGYDPLKEVIEHNERLELDKDKARRNHLEDVARDYHPFIRDEIDGIQTKHIF